MPAKKLTLASTRPTTAGLAPAGKLTVEEKVDEIEAEVWAEVAARQQKEETKELKALAGGTSAPAVCRTLAVDPDLDLSVEDMEEAIYACLA